jgi:hypothetical protein
MDYTLKRRTKMALSKVLPDSLRWQYLTWLPKINTWRRQHTENYPLFSNRYELYDYVQKEYASTGCIEYMEFGVFKGDSIKYWAGINQNPDSKFYGFDTFTGLPELWRNFERNVAKNTFDVNGEFPKTDDKRISFVKGIFQDTLDPFLENYKPTKKQLLINHDSDMYTSTLYTLTRLNSLIKPGTILIFDEFASALHEFRAFDDYVTSYMKKYKVIAVVDDYFTHIAIQFI